MVMAFATQGAARVTIFSVCKHLSRVARPIEKWIEPKVAPAREQDVCGSGSKAGPQDGQPQAHSTVTLPGLQLAQKSMLAPYARHASPVYHHPTTATMECSRA